MVAGRGREVGRREQERAGRVLERRGVGGNVMVAGVQTNCPVQRRLSAVPAVLPPCPCLSMPVPNVNPPWFNVLCNGEEVW